MPVGRATAEQAVLRRRDKDVRCLAEHCLQCDGVHDDALSYRQQNSRQQRDATRVFFSHASNGATFTDVDRQHLYRIKYQQADPDTLDEEVTAA